MENKRGGNVLEELNREDRMVGLSWVFTIGGIILGAVLGLPHAFGITAVVVILFLIVTWRITASPRLGWLLLFGLTAGVLELGADWIHITQFGSLIYTHDFGFRLLASPSYMPAGWWLTVVQFGYLALRLQERIPPWAAVSVVTALGMTIPPWYEEFAAPAQAWHYTTAGPMLSNTPLWIILTYGGSMLAVAASALGGYQPRSWTRALLAGCFCAVGILVSGVVGYALLG